MSRRGKYDRLDQMLLDGTPMHEHGEEFWESKDGRVLHYSKLDDQHLHNVIALVRRRQLGVELLQQIDRAVLNIHEVDQRLVKIMPIHQFLLVEQDKRRLIVAPPNFYAVNEAVMDVRDTRLQARKIERSR